MGQLFILSSLLILKKAGASNRSNSPKNLDIGLKKLNLALFERRLGDFLGSGLSLILSFDSLLLVSLMSGSFTFYPFTLGTFIFVSVAI